MLDTSCVVLAIKSLVVVFILITLYYLILSSYLIITTKIIILHLKTKSDSFSIRTNVVFFLFKRNTNRG